MCVCVCVCARARVRAGQCVCSHASEWQELASVHRSLPSADAAETVRGHAPPAVSTGKGVHDLYWKVEVNPPASVMVVTSFLSRVAERRLVRVVQ